MSSANGGDGLLLTRIIIERRLTDGGGDEVNASFEDSDGEMPGLVELLGMLEITKDTAIRAAMGEDGDDE